MTDPVRDPCVVVAVPARLESARLPGKLLADIAGKPMLQHVLERCRQARGVAAVVVCTDSDQVRAGAAAWGFPVLMTSASCRSGSERLASVVEELVAAAGGLPTETLVINVQGDQPLLDPGIIQAMVAQFVALERPPVLTPVYPLAADPPARRATGAVGRPHHLLGPRGPLRLPGRCAGRLDGPARLSP
jgi:3-deoxy-manno-octulosonate cytidylyltransferase (CMP-KDO synthetase)